MAHLLLMLLLGIAFSLIIWLFLSGKVWDAIQYFPLLLWLVSFSSTRILSSYLKTVLSEQQSSKRKRVKLKYHVFAACSFLPLSLSLSPVFCSFQCIFNLIYSKFVRSGRAPICSKQKRQKCVVCVKKKKCHAFIQCQLKRGFAKFHCLCDFLIIDLNVNCYK